MRTLRELSYIGTTTLLTSVGILMMGCSGTVGPEDMDPNGNGTPDATGGGVGTGTGGGVGTGTGTGGGIGTGTGGHDGTGGGGGSVTTCVPGVPVTSQIPRLTNRAYDNVVRDILGVETLSDGSKPSQGLLDDSTGAMEPYMWTAYQNTAADIAAEVMSSGLKSNFMACDPATAPSCYQDTIAAFGRKAFRRPLTQDEIDSFLRLTTVEPAGTPEQIAESILYTFLVSPSFITVPELNDEPAASGGFQLSSHEVAMRLSLALWGSVPDDVLSQAADDGLLTTQEQIAEQATRMIAVRDKAAAQIAAAHSAYLNVSDATHWWQNRPDPSKYPEFTPAAIPALQAELDMFFIDVASNGGTFRDLFLSDVGFVNQDTAALYGLNPADFGPEVERVEFAPGERPGFLTRAGFLVSKAHADTTSPILRGAFVTTDVLGVNPGAPNPDALTTAIPPGDYKTQREVIDALTAGPSCKKCHQEFINPPGFVLERFNAAGVLQETDTSYLPNATSPLGGAVDTTATVSFSESNIKSISTPLELMQEIAAETEPPRLYTEKLVSFVTGRLPNVNDACLVNDVAAKMAAGDSYTILNLFSDMTQADSFRVRTVGN